MDFFTVAWIFMIFSFLGWVAEVSYSTVKHRRFINRGFLNGPLCPIYGAGMVLVYLLLSPFRENMLLLFVMSTILCGALEFAVGFVLDKLFSNKWWDYSDRRFNLCGYICLEFCLLWGALCALIVHFAFEPIEKLSRLLSFGWNMAVVITFSVLALADLISTLIVLIGFTKRLKLLESVSRKLRAGSNNLGEKIYTGALIATEKYDELTEKAAKFGRRIILAFPTMKSARYSDSLLRIKSKVKAQRELSKKIKTK